jgi:membrane-associated protease RseP (regulator of RpoE activity)
VRIVNFKGVDMNRFRFDYDLTFAALMMSPEGHTYSRFGSQDHRQSVARMSIPGLKRAMREVLETHGKNPAPAPAAVKPRLVQDIPAFQGTRMAKEACYHCHFAQNAQVAQMRLDGAFKKDRLYFYPLPENLGITLSVDRNNVVEAVTPGSPAAKAGVAAGDVITGAGGQAVHTDADLRFALNDLPDPGAVTLQVTRAGTALPPARLELPKGWRRYDVSWRPSQGSVPPIIGIWEEPLSPEQKKARGIEADRLALRVSFLFPGEKWVPTRGELKLNDVITGVNGQSLPHLTPRQFHSYFRFNFNVGDTATLNVLRGDQKLEIKVPCMDVGEE